MKNHESYQIIIMRPTGKKPVMTLRSFWAKVIVALAVGLLVSVLVVTVGLLNAKNAESEQNQVIEMLSGELKDLNILLTQKDEEIISLKKKLSMSITHKATPVPDLKPLPKLYPPTAEISDVSVENGRLLFKVVNIKSQSNEVSQGYVYAVFKKGQVYASYPSVTLDEGVPVEKTKGHQFTIKNFKPMSIKIPESIGQWETVTFYIFDLEEKLRLAMLFNKYQIQ
ncbi:MAG TPA: hypothetical protein ENN05_01460 [Deltaproteobacteria bacterium]|nr:hypothetical protein [Deltaproteobacteria bacterium]